MAEAEVGVTQPSPKECQGLRATAETWERGSWHILTETPQKGPSRPHLGLRLLASRTEREGKDVAVSHSVSRSCMWPSSRPTPLVEKTVPSPIGWPGHPRRRPVGTNPRVTSRSPACPTGLHVFLRLSQSRLLSPLSEV